MCQGLKKKLIETISVYVTDRLTVRSHKPEAGQTGPFGFTGVATFETGTFAKLPVTFFSPASWSHLILCRVLMEQ